MSPTLPRPRGPRLELLPGLPDEQDLLRRACAQATLPGRTLRILEAGCGRRWTVDLRGIPHEITGVDLDEKALGFRLHEVGDLQHAVVGDLRTVSLPDAAFDVIFSSYVLEHVDGASKVLDRFLDWLRPGGLIILKIPERASVEGWLARALPFSWHVAFYRHILERSDAGKPGHPPYPVVHDPIVSLDGIREFCAERRLVIRHEFGLDFAYHYRHLRLTLTQRLKLRAITALIRAGGMLSFGRLTSRYSGLLFVIENALQPCG